MGYLLLYIPCCFLTLLVIHAIKIDDTRQLIRTSLIDLGKITVALLIISALSFILNI